MQKSNNDHGDATGRRWLLNFTSQWFLVPQGTGIVAVVLHELDYQFDGLQIISYIFWVLAIISLVGTLAVYLARCVLFPHHVASALRDDMGEVACLASICISYTSIIQMMSLSLVKSWGKGWGTAAYVLWWTNVPLAVFAVVGIPFTYLQLFPNGLANISPPSQLPMIAALTVAAGGGTISQSAEIRSQLQIPVILVSYLLIGVGLPLALALDVLYSARLLEGSRPRGPKSFQEMILCGPWGQGSFALQMLGASVMNGSFAASASGKFLTAAAAVPVGYVSIFAGLLCWGAGTFWWLFAIMGIIHGMGKEWKSSKVPYTLAAWSLVFPSVRSDGGRCCLRFYIMFC